jgi:hypothetical protein
MCFCNYGCSTNPKSSILVTYIPRAIRAGAEIRPNAMVARIEHDVTGRVTGSAIANFCARLRIPPSIASSPPASHY